MIDPGHVLYEDLRDLHNRDCALLNGDAEDVSATLLFLAHRAMLERYEQSTCCATGEHIEKGTS